MNKIVDINKGWTIKAEGKKAEILLYDVIGKDFFEEGISAKEVVEKLNSFKDIENITVRINSPGGLVFEGVAIYNSLIRHPANIDVQIEGVALSAASMIAMAGDTVSIAANGLMMIHDPWSRVMGTANDMRKEAATLDLVKFSIIEAYSRKMSVDKQAIFQLMQDETWFDAESAMKVGLVDTVMNENKIAAKFDLEKFGYKNKVEYKFVQDDNSAENKKTGNIIKFPSASLMSQRMKLVELDLI